MTWMPGTEPLHVPDCASNSDAGHSATARVGCQGEALGRRLSESELLQCVAVGLRFFRAEIRRATGAAKMQKCLAIRSPIFGLQICRQKFAEQAVVAWLQDV